MRGATRSLYGRVDPGPLAVVRWSITGQTHLGGRRSKHAGLPPGCLRRVGGTWAGQTLVVKDHRWSNRRVGGTCPSSQPTPQSSSLKHAEGWSNPRGSKTAVGQGLPVVKPRGEFSSRARDDGQLERAVRGAFDHRWSKLRAELSSQGYCGGSTRRTCPSLVKPRGALSSSQGYCGGCTRRSGGTCPSCKGRAVEAEAEAAAAAAAAAAAGGRWTRHRSLRSRMLLAVSTRLSSGWGLRFSMAAW